jgi:hypothetical protein
LRLRHLDIGLDLIAAFCGFCAFCARCMFGLLRTLARDWFDVLDR